MHDVAHGSEGGHERTTGSRGQSDDEGAKWLCKLCSFNNINERYVSFVAYACIGVCTAVEDTAGEKTATKITSLAVTDRHWWSVISSTFFI